MSSTKISKLLTVQIATALAAGAAFAGVEQLSGPRLTSSQTDTAASSVEIRISTAGHQGTYAAVFRDIRDVCPAKQIGATLTERNGSGSIESIERLTNNEAHGAIVQEDVLFARAEVMELGNVKSLVKLYPELIHFLVRASPDTVPAAPVRRTVSSLDGRLVAAWGGSITTARLLQKHGQLNFRLVEFADQEGALASLMGGQVEAIVAVGGAPLAWVRALDSSISLLGVPDDVMGRLARIYKPAKMTYSNLSSDVVTTLSTDAVLVVQNYQAPVYQKPLLKLRECLGKRLAELQSTIDRRSNWRSVDLSIKGTWPAYEATREVANPKTVLKTKPR